MQRITTFLTLFVSLITLAQERVIEATVLDINSKEPIAFVNIGFVDRGIGTVSNHEGHFKLEYRETLLDTDDVLRISCMGYTTRELSAATLKELDTGVKLYLKPSETTLPPIVISSSKRAYEKLGSETYSRNDLGYWNDHDALGGELATRIHVDRPGTRLHDLKFNILENTADSILVRINVYDCQRNMPGKNILNENIYHTITKKTGVDTIQLKPHRVLVDDDVVIGIELVEVYGESLYLSVSATPFGGTAYLRERSQDHWDVRWGFGLGFGVLSSYPEPREDQTVNSQ